MKVLGYTEAQKKKHVYVDLTSGTKSTSAEGSNVVSLNSNYRDSNEDVRAERQSCRQKQNVDMSDEDDDFVTPGEVFDNSSKSVPSGDIIRDSKLKMTRIVVDTDVKGRINEVRKGLGRFESKSRKRMRGGDVMVSFFLEMIF